MKQDNGVSVEVTLPVDTPTLRKTVERIEEALRLCDIVGKIETAPDGKLRIVFIPRHMGIRIPHGYWFVKKPTERGIVLEGKALLRRLTIQVEVSETRGGSLLKIKAVCSGPEILRRVARKEVHRFLGQLSDALYSIAKGSMAGEKGSGRSPSLTFR